MAIYSLNVSSIGKTTHAAGTAGAHIRYISRDGSNPHLLADHLAPEMHSSAAWFDSFEETSRKNARVADKVRIALPKELSPDQRADLVKDYMRDLVGGRVPWYGAIHQEGKDKHNPHVHIIIHDRDYETGVRVLKLSDSKRDRVKAGLPANGVDHVRERWEVICNDALQQRGHEQRIDRRSLEDQGIDRIPTIHIGAKAKKIEQDVHRPVSQVVVDGRGKVIDYPHIDGGKTRTERNAEIIDLNLERQIRSGDTETQAKARFYKEQQRRDAVLERRLIVRQRRRVSSYRHVRKKHNKRIHRLIKSRKKAHRAGLKKIKSDIISKLEKLRLQQKQERAALQKAHKKIVGRFIAAVDITGTIKAKRAEQKQQLAERQKEKRNNLKDLYNRRKITHDEGIKRSFQKSIDRMNREKFSILDELRQAYTREASNDDKERQSRERERSYESSKLEQALEIKKRQKKQQPSRGFSRGR